MMKRIVTLLLALMLLVGAAAAEFADFTDLYPDKFLPAGSEPIKTENSYQSENIYVSITNMRDSNCDVFVADIYVRSVECFQRAYAGGDFKKGKAKVQEMSQNRDGVIAITGDSAEYFTVGWAAGNGVIHRDTKNRKRDICIVYKDGTMVPVDSENIDNEQIRADAEAGKIWHIFLFGPVLQHPDGTAKTDFSDSSVRGSNPRTVIGYYAPGHYCFVVVDGRKMKSKVEENAKSVGMKFPPLAQLMEKLGCAASYNLDGGRSTVMVFDNEVYSRPAISGARELGDAVLIVDVPRETADTAQTEAE